MISMVDMGMIIFVFEVYIFFIKNFGEVMFEDEFLLNVLGGIFF